MSLSNILVYLCLTISSQFTLQEGDLLFQDSDCGAFCEAIEKVTNGYNGSNLSHVGIVIHSDNNELAVLEAITKGVVITPLDDFFERSYDSNGNSKVLVGRVKAAKKHLIPQAIKYAKSLLGKSYDSVFDIENDQYYCSELVYEAFKNANDGKSLFSLFPMTFIDPDTQETFDIWVDYFKDLGIAIPERGLGLNPGGISRSDQIEIIHQYGRPSGMKNQ